MVMVVKILIEHMCLGRMGVGELSDLILLETNFGACSWRASQFVMLIFEGFIDSLTGLNILTGGRDREVRVGPLRAF